MDSLRKKLADHFSTAAATAASTTHEHGSTSSEAAAASYSESTLRQYWMPDAVSDECYECASRFTTFRRKHHCRICGQIFCSKCCGTFISGKHLKVIFRQNVRISSILTFLLCVKRFREPYEFVIHAINSSKKITQLIKH